MGPTRIRSASAEEIYDVVRSSGGRLTVPMRMAVTVLVESDRHLTADELIAEIERRTPGIAPSTIYRLLQRLDELDVIEHVHTGGSAAFYHLREHGHAHLVCNECGTITDIPDTVFDGLCRTVQRTYHFTVEPRHAALLGRCEQCQQSNHPARHATEPSPAG